MASACSAHLLDGVVADLVFIEIGDGVPVGNRHQGRGLWHTQDLDFPEHQATQVLVAGMGHLHGQNSLQRDDTTSHQAVYPEREACVNAIVF